MLLNESFCEDFQVNKNINNIYLKGKSMLYKVVCVCVYECASVCVYVNVLVCG